MIKKAQKIMPYRIKQIDCCLHPGNKSSIQFYRKNKIVVKKYRKNIFKNYSLIIGMFSTLLVEAYLEGKTVITIQPFSNQDKCVLSQKKL